MADTALSILVIDDDESARSSITAALSSEGFAVESASDGAMALARCSAHEPDLVVCDVFMPKRDGLDTIKELRRSHPSVKIICLTGGGMYGLTDVLAIARRLGADRTISKPIDFPELIALVNELLAERPDGERGE